MVFNLLDRDWIPVLWANGRPDRVGIRTALTEAGRIRQIAASNPMDNVALLRFLLALLYWCKGNPPNDGNAASGDASPEDWFSKLDANKEWFNLLGEGKRFYQDSAARRPRAVTDLIQEIPTGNNFWHFRHSTDGSAGLCPACCAMGLLRLPVFAVSGLPDLRAGINGTPPIYVVPWGRSLLQTLLANWLPSTTLGEPAWTRPDIRLLPDQDVPLLTGLTLLSRRVWLHDPSEPPGLCIGCGARETALIRACEFQTAGEQRNDRWHDPHVVYSDGKRRKAVKAADLTAPGKFRMDRPWSELLIRMIESRRIGPGGKSTSLLVVGFATDKAKNIDVWQRIIAVPSTQSIQETAASWIEMWQKEGRRLEKRMGRLNIQGRAVVAAVRPHVEHGVSARAVELLAGGRDAWEQAATEYRPMMAMVAKALSPGVTTAAVRRRRQLGSVAPDMGPTAEPADRARRKKGHAK